MFEEEVLTLVEMVQTRGSRDVFFELEVRPEEVPVSRRACYP